MKERVLNNWSFIRVLYLVIGTLMVVQTAMSREWLGVLIGSYFVVMGLFSIGCTSGTCYGGNCTIESNKNSNSSIQDVELEEVKVK